MSKVLKRPLLLIPLLLLFPLTAKSQGVRVKDILLSGGGRPIAGATVTVCPFSPSDYNLTSGVYIGALPCNTTVPIYANITLTNALVAPVLTDGLGNYAFWIFPGTYTLCFHGPNVIPTCDAISPGGAGSGAGPNIQTNEVNNLSQALLDFQNATETPAGKQISALNPSGGIEHLFLRNVQPSTGGSAFIGDISNLQTGQVICSDSTVHLTNCTPAILVNEQTGTSYAILATDREKIIRQINSSASTYTIPQAGTTGFEAGFATGIVNNGSGTLTLTPTTSTITYGTTVGASSMPLTSGQAAYLYDDGTNYTAVIIGATSIPVQEKTCMMQFGSDGAAVPLATTDYFPQMSPCFVKAAGTVDTVIVMADSGASTVRVGFDVNGSYTQISPTLTPATVSGIADKVACANTGGTPITIKGTSVTCSVLSSTSIAAGQYLEPSAGTADGVTKRLSIAVTWQ